MIQPSKRIENIDIIRGVALLGLLSMNLVGMSMPFSAYFNPLAINTDGFLNDAIFATFHLFSDQKFMGTFSLLFGCSMMLLIDNLKNRGQRAWTVHYMRNLWLLLFGLVHGLFLWEGDVLFLYALIAFLLYPLHRFTPKSLFAISITLLMLAIYFSGSFNFSHPDYSASAQAELLQLFNPNIQNIKGDVEIMQGSYDDILNYRFEGKDTGAALLDFELFFLLSALFRAAAMMTLGMALYKLGFVQGQFSLNSYRKACTICALIGLPIILLGLIRAYIHHFNMTDYFSPFGTLVLNTLGSVWLVIAYISGINCWCMSNVYRSLQQALANVGRMALSNYLLQSLIGTSIFYGYGLGLFAQVQRWQLVIIMLAIWVVQIAFSRWWLHRFTQGPIEYLWRCLTYFKIQPLLKAAEY